MTSTTFFFIFVPILAIILLAINLIFAPHNPYQEKDSAFECGFHSFLGQNRTQFSISFFIFALLFLLFDLEILLVYPYVVSAYTNGIYGLVIMLVFFLALTLGFAFELGKNALKIDSRQMLILDNTLLNRVNFLSGFNITYENVFCSVWNCIDVIYKAMKLINAYHTFLYACRLLEKGYNYLLPFYVDYANFVTEYLGTLEGKHIFILIIALWLTDVIAVYLSDHLRFILLRYGYEGPVNEDDDHPNQRDKTTGKVWAQILENEANSTYHNMYEFVGVNALDRNDIMYLHKYGPSLLVAVSHDYHTNRLIRQHNRRIWTPNRTNIRYMSIAWPKN